MTAWRKVPLPPTALRLALLGALLAALPLIAAPGFARGAPPPSEAPPQDLVLMSVQPGQTYAQWMAAGDWADRRPFSPSARRFRIEDGALRLESRGDSYLIGRVLPAGPVTSIDARPYLRFVVRIARVPEGANLIAEARDDSAFRLYATFEDAPPRALVYAWSWTLPVGTFSARGRSLWGDFRNVRRKAFGRGPPDPQRWLTVEVNLRDDFRHEFPGLPLPPLRGLALKADSNHTPGGASLAWLRSVSLHARSLREAGLREGDPYGETTLWFR